MNKKVAVIGGGPSGIIASIILSKYLDVTIFEKMPKIGKKIIASGNGKCNITNLSKINIGTYNNAFACEVYNKYPANLLVNDLLKLGIITKEDSELRVYPITNSSSTVMDNFLYHLEKNNVKIYTDTLVVEIVKNNNKYTVKTLNNIYQDYDYVIISTGGMSSKQLGSNGEGYTLLSKYNIEKTNLMPGLVGLKIKKDLIKGLEGIRQKASIRLEYNNQVIFKEFGEVQFKKDGISGIVVMNASSIISRNNLLPTLYLDLIPNYSEIELTDKLTQIKINNQDMDNYQLLKAILPKMLAKNIYDKVKSSLIKDYVNLIKNFKLDIISTYDFDSSQVTVGGIKIDEINKDFESIKLPNLYIIGELLDVDGLCGGFNIHFALASGTLASKSILNKENKTYE